MTIAEVPMLYRNLGPLGPLLVFMAFVVLVAWDNAKSRR